MPDQERKYGTRITTAGSTLITNCILAGTKLKITQAAAGAATTCPARNRRSL